LGIEFHDRRLSYDSSAGDPDDCWNLRTRAQHIVNGRTLLKFPEYNTLLDMFDGSDFPQSLNEEDFDLWLENGRQSKIRYNYLLIIWDAYESKYLPVYATHRDETGEYETYQTSTGRESLVAAYDLYSETRIV
jgi:hypothetical protein